jgi:hypothetical protein
MTMDIGVDCFAVFLPETKHQALCLRHRGWQTFWQRFKLPSRKV